MDTLVEVKKLGTTFHRTFTLNRPAMKQVLELVYEKSGENELTTLERQVIRELTNLGSIYVEAMPRYCIGTGLLRDGFVTSKFGEFSYRHDPLLENHATQWLMHYYLSAVRGPGPVFWNELVSTYFRSGNEFTTTEITSRISDIYQHLEGVALAKNSANATTAVFLGTYTKSDGLGNLSLLEKIDDSHYRVGDDFDPPPTWAIAYAVLDHWQVNYAGRLDVPLNDLTQQLSSVLLVGTGKLARVLYTMQSEGILVVDQTLPPYKVRLLRPEVEPVLERLYAHDDTF